MKVMKQLCVTMAIAVVTACGQQSVESICERHCDERDRCAADLGVYLEPGCIRLCLDDATGRATYYRAIAAECDGEVGCGWMRCVRDE